MKITLEQAATCLNSGLVVAVPTETVYGLAASLDFPHAIKEIFRLKGRPSNNPLIVHLASAEAISLYVKELPPNFSDLASTFWPGPLTLIISVIEETIPEVARAKLPTAAFRVPSHPLTRELLKKTGPLVMPSANLSGKPSATSAQHVENDFGSGFSVLDGGKCIKGLESTILCWDHGAWTVIRLGALAPEAFLPVLGYIPKVVGPTREQEDTPLCPGQLYRHYSPKAQLILMDKIPDSAQGAIIGFSDRVYPKDCGLFSLGHSNDPNSAAQKLYAVLRQLDVEGVDQAIVDMDFSHTGLWITLRERLQKASHK